MAFVIDFGIGFQQRGAIMRGLAIVLIGTWAFVGAASCGSSSSDTDSSDGGGTGGTGGTGGSAGSGTGGASGSATGGTAGSSTGGSAGSSGGTAGSSGGTAGSSGSAGSSSGGAAGSAGAGGTGGVGDKCDPLCTALVAANCQNGPSSSGCKITCKALTSSSTCDQQANSYFDCAAATTITCNGAGEPVAQGCGLEWLAAIGCAVQESPNQALVAPCDAYCDKVVAANCGNNGTKNVCNTNCLWAGVTGTGCDDEWGAFLTCANGVTLTCLAGYAVAPGCGPAFNTYRQCMQAAGT
jgi:hypothetical protein